MSKLIVGLMLLMATTILTIRSGPITIVTDTGTGEQTIIVNGGGEDVPVVVTAPKSDE